MRFHKIKSLILSILDKIPTKLGFYFYHQIQKRTFKKINAKIIANENSYEIVKKILSKNNINLKGEKVLEIGSGWLPLMPYLLKINEDITEIHTYDINKHYNKTNLEKIDKYFQINHNKKFEYHSQKGFKLPNFIYYYPNSNVILEKLPSQIKLYFSRFVLEHVYPTDIQKMHLKLFNEMDEGSYVLHLISPSDHRAYSDSSLSYYDFLKYSQHEWDKIQTKFDYHNRFRLPQYIDIFKEIGFEIVFLEYDKIDIHSLKYKQYRKLNIHSDYINLNETEILAGSINILLKKRFTTLNKSH